MNQIQGEDVLLGLDVGTSGARASAYTQDGVLVGSVRESYPTWLPREGWAEQDAHRWRSAALAACHGLTQQLGSSYRIRGIGVTGQCPSVVPVDGAGRPIRAGIIYRDNRAAAEARQVRRRIGEARLHARTGHVLAAFHVAAKMLWIRAHEPGIFESADRFLGPTDVVVHALTGEVLTDWTVAAANGLFDIRAREWATDLLRSVGLDPQQLPSPVPSWQVAGEISPRMARRMGLREPVPVLSGIGDSIACILGVGVTQPGPASEMAGSSTCLNTVVPAPLADTRVTHYPSGTEPDGYVTEVGMNTTGEAVDWAVELAFSGRRGRPTHQDYERFDQSAGATPAGADGLLFLPVLGDGERDAPDLRGAAVGLSLRQGKEALARAVLEGVALGIRAHLDTLGNASTPATELRVSGRAAALQTWNQIKADVLGIPVRPVAGDATAAGAAMVAGIGVGIYRDSAEAVAAAYRPEPALLPRPSNRNVYDEVYQRYLDLAAARVVRVSSKRGAS